MKTLKHSFMVLALFFCLVQGSKGQCYTVNTIPNYNCVTGVCEITITITNSSISPPYTITSSPAGINGVTSGTTFTMTNIPFQLSYNITVTGSGTCTALGQVYYTNPTSPVNIAITQSNVSCFGGSDGAALASFGGVGPYTWHWSTGATSPSVSNLAPGVYTVTIGDSRNCVATKPFTITEAPEIKSSFSTTLIACNGASVTSAITTTGGSSPFSYTVNGNAITTPPGNVATNITAGPQTIITKDTKGCVKTNTFILSQAAQQVITSTVSSPNCPGDTNGSAAVTVSGPVAGYSYTWYPVNSSGSSISAVPAGNYTLSVQDASNCITNSVITIPPALAMTPVALVSKENCSAADGAFTLMVSGGTAPYSYTTQPGNVIGNVVSGLSTGSYTTVIKDARGCLDSTKTNVGNLSTVSLHILTVTPVQCYNNCNGSVILNTQNGVLPVTYSITGLPSTTNNAVSNLCAGFYIVKAVDHIGCPAFDTINFPQLPVFSYSAATPPPVCIGKKVKLQASAVGGNGAYTYIWNPGNLNGQEINVDPVVTTVYSLNVYDGKGCTLPPYTVTVNINPKISIAINSSASGICPGTTAQITPTISGGDGNYTYMWLPGNSKGSSIFVENITVPTYTLFVNDGCGTPQAEKEITIRLHPVTQPLYKEEGKGGCMPYCTRFINITPGSRNPVWNFGDRPVEEAGDTALYCYDKAGSFNLRLTVTDSNSCRSSFTYTNAVKVLVRPEAGFITEPGTITLNDAEDVLIRNISDNASLYEWSVNGIYQGSTRNIHYTFRDTGCYDIKLVTANANLCKDSTIRSICVFEGFNFYMPNAFSPNQDGVNDVLLPKGTGWLYDNYRLEIFNRWGIRVFFTTDVHTGWNGDVELDPFRQEVLSANQNDIYVWRVSLTDNLQKEHVLKGTVTLLR